MRLRRRVHEELLADAEREMAADVLRWHRYVATAFKAWAGLGAARLQVRLVALVERDLVNLYQFALQLSS